MIKIIFNTSCRPHIKRLIVMCMLSFSYFSYGMDVIRINHDMSPTDSRTLYKIDVLNKVMQATEAKYGPYKIIMQGPATTTSRAILEVKSGVTINTFLAITTKEWEENTLPIRLPVRRGVLSYRLLATTQEKLPLFEDLNSIDELKKLKVGLRKGWVTTELLKSQGYNVFEANSYEGLFYMLSTGRIDYFPRGMNEIYKELSTRQKKLKNLVVEPNLALYIPAPYYFFVSPHDKKLAQRITEGLEIIIANKELNKVFNAFYGEDIDKANLLSRSILNVGNPQLSPKTPTQRKSLWLEND